MYVLQAHSWYPYGALHCRELHSQFLCMLKDKVNAKITFPEQKLSIFFQNIDEIFQKYNYNFNLLYIHPYLKLYIIQNNSETFLFELSFSVSEALTLSE